MPRDDKCLPDFGGNDLPGLDSLGSIAGAVNSTQSSHESHRVAELDRARDFNLSFLSR